MFPNLPGVPALSKNNLLAAGVTVAAPLINSLLDKLKPTWGIYDVTGSYTVIKPDSFISAEYRNEFNVSNFPIERGAFNSYNKVRTPYVLHVKISKGSAITSVGTSSRVTDRGDFIQVIENMVKSLDLYTVMTPEANYYNANLEGYDYRREVKEGVGIIIASLRFVEILQAGIMSSSDNTIVAPDPIACPVSAQASVSNGICSAGIPAALPTGITIR